MRDAFRREQGIHPPLDTPAYGSSRLRAPVRIPLTIPQTVTEVTGPVLGERDFG